MLIYAMSCQTLGAPLRAQCELDKNSSKPDDVPLDFGLATFSGIDPESSSITV